MTNYNDQALVHHIQALNNNSAAQTQPLDLPSRLVNVTPIPVTMNTTTRLEWADAIEHTQPSRTTTNLPPIDNNNSTPSQQWIDSFAAAMERRQKPKALDLQQFLADPRPPMLTEDDMQRFARKPSRTTH